MHSPSLRFRPAFFALFVVLTATFPAWAQSDEAESSDVRASLPAPLRLELAGERQSLGTHERFNLSIHLRGGRATDRYQGLAIVSLPSETPLFAALDPHAADAASLALRFATMGATYVDHRGLAAIDQRIEVSVDDPAASVDDTIAIWAYRDGERIEWTRAEMRGERFGLVAEVPAAALIAKSVGPNVACFAWDCGPSLANGDSGECHFDASCSTTSEGLLWKHYWQWGDGSASLLPGTVDQTVHVFAPHGQGPSYYNVTLDNWYFGSASSPSVTCCVRVHSQRIGPNDNLHVGVCADPGTYQCIAP